MSFGYRKTKAKYGNEKTTTLCNYGFSHRSKLERALCDQIWLREKAGELVCEKHEDRVYLSDARVAYIPDFRCTMSDGRRVYFEAKGYPSQRWPTVKKLWKHYGPGELQIFGGTHSRLLLLEKIIPKPLAESQETNSLPAPLNEQGASRPYHESEDEECL